MRAIDLKCPCGQKLRIRPKEEAWGKRIVVPCSACGARLGATLPSKADLITREVMKVVDQVANLGRFR